jgi:serine/threonine-protein kinase
VTLDQQAVIDALPAYEIGGELGRGGWGVVLAGKHRQLGRDVAIKQLPRAFAADESIRSRFTVEAKLLASLDHPHIVPVYDFVEQDGLCLLVMELLPGGTVWSRFTTDGFTASGASAVVLACLSGLQAAHGRHVLHRDIKPENLMFSSTGALKVTDFGIAKVVGGEETMATRAGEVVGTPAYIAPEQARGGELSPATDVYAVATMLYELLCGQLPFADDGDAMALMFKHAFEQPEPLLDKAPGVPEPVAAVVMSGLATDPAERPDSAEHFGVALAEACTSAWGPGWLPTDGTPVMGASSIVAATERASGPPAGPTLERAPVTAEAGPAPATVPRHAAGASATVARPPTTPVRPTVTVHAHSAALDDVTEGAADLVPVKEVLTPPPSPARYFVAAAVLLIVAFVIALVGVGASASSSTLAAGQVNVAGTDVASGGTVTLNLSKPVPVLVSGTAPAADHVELAATVLGQQVSSATAPLVPAGTGRAATVSLGGRYLVGGSFTGKVTLWRGLLSEGDATFSAHTSQSGLLSVPAGITLILLLFTLGYAESLQRSLRHGKSTKTAPVGLALIGAVFGVALVGVGWVLFRQVPTAASLVICAVLGAGAGVALAFGAIGVGRQDRFRRIVKREERQAAKAAA